VTRSGGTIRAQSRPGEGATFVIEWPVADGNGE
jgi:signal transduction histidine kinase